MGTASALSLLSLAILAYATWNGWTAAQDEVAAIDRSLTTASERLAAIRAEAWQLDPASDPFELLGSAIHPASVASRAWIPAVKAPQPLGFLGIPHNDLQPSIVRVSEWALELHDDGQSMENPTLQATSGFDLIFVLVHLLPLFALGLGFDIVTRERALGTWRMSMAQAVPPSTVILGTCLVRSTLLLVPALSFVWLATGVLAGGDGITAQVVALSVGLVLYLGFWFFLGLLLGLRAESTSAAGLRALAAWVILAVFTPSLIQTAAGVAHPAPSRFEFVRQLGPIYDETFTGAKALMDEVRRTDPTLRPAPDAPLLDIAGDDWGYLTVYYREFSRRLTPHVERLEYAAAAQDDVVRLWQLSPVIPMSRLLTEIAGRSDERHRDFTRRVRRFHRARQDQLLHFIYRAEWMTPEAVARVPDPLVYEDRSGGRTDLQGPLLILALFGGGVLLVVGREVVRLNRELGNP